MPIEWIVIGIVVVIAVVVLARIVRSREGPYSPGMETKGGLAAFGATMVTSRDQDRPEAPPTDGDGAEQLSGQGDDDEADEADEGNDADAGDAGDAGDDGGDD